MTEQDAKTEQNGTAAIWFLYFAAILFMIFVMILLAHDMSH